MHDPLVTHSEGLMSSNLSPIILSIILKGVKHHFVDVHNIMSLISCSPRIDKKNFFSFLGLLLVPY